MEVFAELGQVGTGIDQPLGEVARMAGGKTDPFNALHVVDVMEQIREGVLAATLRRDARQIAAVGINVLAEQGDFLVALGGKTLHFQLDRLGQP